jgi:hypothetical protein
MAEIIHGQRSMFISEVWERNSPIYLSVSAFDGFDAYVGTLPLTKPRKYSLGPQTDNSSFDDILKGMNSIPRQDIYLAVCEGITQFERSQGRLGHDGNFYFKAPNVSNYAGNGEIAKSVLDKAKTNERLMKHPHSNSATYLGCIVHDGLIVRLVFRKYLKTLCDRIL